MYEKAKKAHVCIMYDAMISCVCKISAQETTLTTANFTKEYSNKSELTFTDHSISKQTAQQMTRYLILGMIRH